MAAIIEAPAGKKYGELTGQYQNISSSGNQYILVVCDYDLNAIIGEALKSRHKGDILNVYRNVHKQLSNNVEKPQIQTLDNEASDILLEYIKKMMYSWGYLICITEI